MAGHLTSGQMVLVKKLKKNVEKYVTAMSHLEFLQKCQEINIVPRSLNLAGLVKSAEVWETESENTYGTLLEASKKLLESQINKWDKKLKDLDNEGNQLKLNLIYFGF